MNHGYYIHVPEGANYDSTKIVDMVSEIPDMRTIKALIKCDWIQIIAFGSKMQFAAVFDEEFLLKSKDPIATIGLMGSIICGVVTIFKSNRSGELIGLPLDEATEIRKRLNYIEGQVVRVPAGGNDIQVMTFDSDVDLEEHMDKVQAITKEVNKPWEDL